MAMLAEPKRKQKWTLNPRGKQWSEDSNKFGQKMLEKMGWTSGKGLGANEQGMTEHVRVRFKDDAGGIGYSKDDQDKYWTEQQENFNELLQNLQADSENHEDKVKFNEISKLSGKSLELKSKQSRARVHYQKFTRGKDVNKYSTKDLANIFGKKELLNSDKIEEIHDTEDDNLASIGSTDTTAGVLTIKGGSMNDYFKSKFSNFQLTNKNDEKSSESENERHYGFGFSSPSIFSPDSKNNHEKIVKFTPKKRKSEFYVETPKKIDNHQNYDDNHENFEDKSGILDEKLEIIENFEVNLKKKKKKRKNDNLDDNSSEIDEKKLKKRKKNQLNIDNSSSIDRDHENYENSSEKLKNKSKFIFENQALDLASSSPISEFKKSKKKGKKEREPLECIPEVSESPKTTKTSNFIFSNSALEINSPNPKKIDKKSKKSNSDDKKISKNDNFIFENPALDLNSPESQNEPKERRKKIEIGYVNESVNFKTDENPEKTHFYDNSSVFEIPREPGLANEALDLTDETDSKKRVTFNNEIEYNTDFRKKKTRKKLDKFEVDNEKLQKKLAKKEAEVQNTGFVNPALDVDVVDDEAVENEENERKSKSEKRKKRRISNLETIEEIPEEEKTDDSFGATPSKKRRRGEGEKENCEGKGQMEGEVGEDLNSEIVDEFESPRMIRTGKSKRILKSLFAKSPMLNFNGSNVNEIKGYGVE